MDGVIRSVLFLASLTLLLSDVTSSASFLTSLPAAWKNACDVRDGVTDDVNATLSCHVTGQDDAMLRLDDLRTTFGSLKVAVKVTCGEGGLVSLPWPMRCPGLVKLTVRGCRLVDKYADFNSSATQLRDSLTHLDVRDSVWLNDPADMMRVLLNPGLVSGDYECGQDSSLVVNVYRNVSDSDLDTVCAPLYKTALKRFKGNTSGGMADIVSLNKTEFHKFTTTTTTPGQLSAVCARYLLKVRDREEERSKSNAVDPLDDPLATLGQLDKIKTSCRYEQLEVMDESYSDVLHRLHFQYLVENAKFPRLRVLNYSHTGIDTLPLELRQWRRYFQGSKLEVIDLSYCKVKVVGPIPPLPNPLGSKVTTIDLRFNNITSLSKEMVDGWAAVPDLVVDIRHNPIHCDCHVTPLLGLVMDMQNTSKWSGKPYSVYRDLLAETRCVSPSRLAGREITSLKPEDVSCVQYLTSGVGTFHGDDVFLSLKIVVAGLLLLLLKQT